MANRSYLYTIDFDRTKGKRIKGEKIYGLSEYPYSIPLSFKILVSQDSRISLSINWDYEHPIAIQGDFEKGQNKLLDFLNKLREENIFSNEELEERIKKTKEFLNEHKLHNIILECGEIYEMGDGKLENQNKEFYEQNILKIDNQILEYLNDFKKMKKSIEDIKLEITELLKPKGFLAKLFSSDNKKKILELENKASNLKKEMWKMLGIDYWSDILYFHFENE